MADFDWRNKCVKNNLMRIEIADTFFYLSLWENNDPFTIMFLDGSQYAIKVEAYPDFPRKILSFRECQKGLMLVGFLSIENIGSQAFKDELRLMILKFFNEHPDIIDTYNKYHPTERIYWNDDK